MDINVFGWDLLISTDDKFIRLGHFFSDVPVTNTEIKIRIQQYAPELFACDINECVMIASDGEELDFYDIEPTDVFPVDKNHKCFCAKNGGENKRHGTN